MEQPVVVTPHLVTALACHRKIQNARLSAVQAHAALALLELPDVAVADLTLDAPQVNRVAKLQVVGLVVRIVVHQDNRTYHMIHQFTYVASIAIRFSLEFV